MIIFYVGDLMPGKRQFKWGKDITITEGNKDYPLKLELYKSRLIIKDDEGNKIAVDKRDNWIKIQPWGNVAWHRGKGKKQE